MKALLIFVCVLLATQTALGQDPLEAQVQAQKNKEREALSQAQKAAQEKRMAASAAPSKELFEKLSYRQWEGPAVRMNSAAGSAVGVKAKLVRVFGVRFSTVAAATKKGSTKKGSVVQPGEASVVNFAEVEVVDSGGTTWYVRPVGDDRKYVEAFLRAWNAERLTSPPASAASSPDNGKDAGRATGASADPVMDDSNASQPVVSSSASATYREWTDSTGKFRLTARLASVKVGDLPVALPESLGSTVKVELTNKDGKTVTVSYSQLSKEDQGFLKAKLLREQKAREEEVQKQRVEAQKQEAEGQAQTLEEMRSSHTNWNIRMPQTKVGTARHDQIVASGTNASNVQWGSKSYLEEYTIKGLGGYQPVEAELVSFDGHLVVLQAVQTTAAGRSRAGKAALNGQVQQATFNYNNFQDADKKFLDNYRKLEKSLQAPKIPEKIPDKSPGTSKAGGSVLGE